MKIKLTLLVFSIISASQEAVIPPMRSSPFKIAMALAQVIVTARKGGRVLNQNNPHEEVILERMLFHIGGAEVTNREKFIFNKYVNRHNIQI